MYSNLLGHDLAEDVLGADGEAAVRHAVEEGLGVGVQVHEDVLHLGRRDHPRAADHHQHLFQFVEEDDRKVRAVVVHVVPVELLD